MGGQGPSAPRAAIDAVRAADGRGAREGEGVVQGRIDVRISSRPASPSKSEAQGSATQQRVRSSSSLGRFRCSSSSLLLLLLHALPEGEDGDASPPPRSVPLSPPLPPPRSPAVPLALPPPAAPVSPFLRTAPAPAASWERASPTRQLGRCLEPLYRLPHLCEQQNTPAERTSKTRRTGRISSRVACTFLLASFSSSIPNTAT